MLSDLLLGDSNYLVEIVAVDFASCFEACLHSPSPSAFVVAVGLGEEMPASDVGDVGTLAVLAVGALTAKVALACHFDSSSFAAVPVVELVSELVG